MSELVERVARVLCAHQICQNRKWDTQPDKLAEMLPAAIDYAWPEFVERATVAMDAMREQTKPEPTDIEAALSIACGQQANDYHGTVFVGRKRDIVQIGLLRLIGAGWRVLPPVSKPQD